MNKIISRMLVLGLLVSFVQAQTPSKDIDKDAHKANKDVREEAKNKANKAVGGQDMDAARLQDLEGDTQSGAATQGSAKGKGGPKSKGSPNMAPSARVSGDRQLAGTKNTSASGKAVKKGGLGRIFSRIFGGAQKVDGGKSASKEPAAGQSPGVQSPSQDPKEKDDGSRPGPKVEGPPNDGGG